MYVTLSLPLREDSLVQPYNHDSFELVERLPKGLATTRLRSLATPTCLRGMENPSLLELHQSRLARLSGKQHSNHWSMRHLWRIAIVYCWRSGGSPTATRVLYAPCR